MAVVDRLLKVFARSILAKNRALKRLESELTDNQQRRLRMTVVADIRACGGILYPEELPLEVSEAALEAAKRLKVKDLHRVSWQKQQTFDKGRKMFHWEHVETIGEIQRACEKATKVKEVVEILKTKLRIAWILKTEDRALTLLGFKSIRPDANVAYGKAKIVLVKPTTAGDL